MQNIWLFQANPDHWDFTFEVQPGKVDDWGPKQLLEEISDGDAVVIWASGNDAGVRGFGRIVGELFDDNRINIEIVERLDPPLARSDLLNHPVLKAMRVLRMPFGSNPFKVTAGEWDALKSLVPPTNQRQE